MPSVIMFPIASTRSTAAALALRERAERKVDSQRGIMSESRKHLHGLVKLIETSTMLALPPKSNGATPVSNGANVNGGDHA